MSLDSLRGAYTDLSGIASTVARQLAFAGIALIWIFKTDQSDGLIAIPIGLLWPTVGLIIALALDLLQYAVASLVWGSFARIKERQLREHARDAEQLEELSNNVDAPAWLNWPSIAFFWGKLFAVLSSYVLLLDYVLGKINFV